MTAPSSLTSPPPPAAEAAPAAEADGSHLRAYLADHHTPCPLCGYDLYQLAGPRCPECGNALRLQVGLVDPKLGWYIASLSAACVGLGGSGFFVVLALFAAPASWWEELAPRLLLVELVLTAVIVPALLWRRRRFRAMPLGWQVGAAVTLWAFVLVMSALVIALFD